MFDIVSDAAGNAFFKKAGKSYKAYNCIWVSHSKCTVQNTLQCLLEQLTTYWTKTIIWSIQLRVNAEYCTVQPNVVTHSFYVNKLTAIDPYYLQCQVETVSITKAADATLVMIVI